MFATRFPSAWACYYCCAVFMACSVSRVMSCESNPMDAMLVASQIGRATNHIFKNCSHYLKEFKPNPPMQLLYEFLKSVCDAIDLCRERFPKNSFQENVPCFKETLRAKWIPTKLIPLDQMETAQTMMLCMAVKVPSDRVAKHVVAYLMKVAG
ncbi:uncharacterized protein LOC144145195 isoform X1 [Haemaphysalis longicornis]